MAQHTPVEKRLRISLLLDAYGELLTEKQSTFLRLYYEEDLSFGEIAQEYSVSRQAIFDSVKHGEDALEEFERVLRLIQAGWAQVMQGGLTAHELLAKLRKAQKALHAGKPDKARRELETIIEQMARNAAETNPAEAWTQPPAATGT